jgi:hypothetical protein
LRLEVTVRINGILAKAVVDSGANMLVISSDWVDKNEIPFKTKKHPILVALANDLDIGYGGGVINMETRDTVLKVGGIKDQVNLNIIDIGN